MAASRRRYFLLDELVPADRVADMMGCIVQDIFLPLYRYAPATPVDGTLPRARSPRDILPNILPQPIVATSRKAVLESLPTKQLQISLAELFGLTIKREHNDAVEIEGEAVKQYSLSQSREVFEYLMRDSAYASEAQKFLRDTARNRAFFVTGFMTTSSTTLKRTSGRKVEYGFNISIPISSASGGPALLDPQLAPSVSSDTSVSQETVLPDECIFAMSYDIIALTRRFDIQAPRFVQHSIKHQGLKRAKPQHLAMGRDDGSDEEIEDEEEEIKQPPASSVTRGTTDGNLGNTVEHMEELEDISQI
ncbi:MAG: hypothetical protein HETSPECPRED_002216 [Heterodermia speciosa]|uniref:Uncharacterized protein n=1 Tax=Heterodermia speciosa TaxID=116794 RepID=A0A8H3J452_9LECA|nr:MAG: hypothetical protein HETSPECPRED_002216 [Heterodermia speciosa]